jgi:hypothetical protein
MNSNEFVFWLKGIVDSTDSPPTKKTWDKIIKILDTVKLNKKETTPFDDAVIRRLHDLNSGNPPNPYEIIFKNKNK